MKTQTIFEVWRTIRTFIRWGGIIGVAYIFFNTIVALADKELIKVNVLINALLNFTANVYISWSIAIAATIYGFAERRLRRKKIKEMASRINELEKMLWPHKVSSKINLDGTTNKEDI